MSTFQPNKIEDGFISRAKSNTLTLYKKGFHGFAFAVMAFTAAWYLSAVLLSNLPGFTSVVSVAGVLSVWLLSTWAQLLAKCDNEDAKSWSITEGLYQAINCIWHGLYFLRYLKVPILFVLLIDIIGLANPSVGAAGYDWYRVARVTSLICVVLVGVVPGLELYTMYMLRCKGVSGVEAISLFIQDITKNHRLKLQLSLLASGWIFLPAGASTAYLLLVITPLLFCYYREAYTEGPSKIKEVEEAETSTPAPIASVEP